jgi:hypothetical protein
LHLAPCRHEIIEWLKRRELRKALIVANAFLETELEKLRAAVSTGYARGKLLPRDRKD